VLLMSRVHRFLMLGRRVIEVFCFWGVHFIIG